eukprot:5975460-Prymnesium_polylepis.2
MPWLMPRIGGPAKTCFYGVILFVLTRLSCGLLPLAGDGTPLYLCTSVLFFLTGLSYALAEVGGMAYVLGSAPSG